MVSRGGPRRDGTADALSRECRHGGSLSVHARGFSLPELLAVLAMLAIAIAVGVPIVNEQVRIAEIRGVADELALHLRAARVIAVTNHTEIKFKVFVDPTNRFEYPGLNGAKKEIWMPKRVRIADASDPFITFKANGAVEVASTIILEADVSGAKERWTASVNTVGLTTLEHERVN